MSCGTVGNAAEGQQSDTQVHTMPALQGDEASEWEEAEKDVKQAEAAHAKTNGSNGKTNGKQSPPSPGGKQSQARVQECVSQFFSPVFLEAFVLTFCAEWGDRSQIATIGIHLCCLLDLATWLDWFDSLYPLPGL